MARIRSVHPGLWTDEDFVQLSAPARLFLIGMWNESDDYGLFEWKPTRLKMRLAPNDPIDAAALMAELVEHRFLIPIERDGRSLGMVRNFRKWQRPKTPSAPIVPVDAEIISAIGIDKPDEIPQHHRSTSEALPQSIPKPPENPALMEDGGGGMKEGDSVADATGASAPPPVPNIADEVWRIGPSYLIANGVPEKSARSLLGKWRKGGQRDGEVLAALIEAQRQAISDPVAWIEARLNGGGRKQQHAGRTAGEARFDDFMSAAAASARDAGGGRAARPDFEGSEGDDYGGATVVALAAARG